MGSKSQADTAAAAPMKSGRLSQSDVPSVQISEALRVPNALRDNYGLKPATPVDVGLAIGIAPTSGKYRALTGASIAYGLTTGGYNAAEIALTDLGRRVVAPQAEGDDQIAIREAFEKPRVIREFVDKYNGTKLPANSAISRNVLHGMGVPLDATQRVYDLLIAGLSQLGYIRDLNGAQFIQRPKGAIPLAALAPDDQPVEDFDTSDEDGVEETVVPTPPTAPVPPPGPKAIFLGHGKNQKPLEQLIKILDEYRIPHREAIAEPNAGRPIPTKVADTMRECGAAILLFTADEKFVDVDGNEVWRPSENVVHELGAASILYDNRIIIFKEDSLTLASNFSAIGYIAFEKDKLGDKGIDLFRELVNFKIVNISVGG